MRTILFDSTEDPGVTVRLAARVGARRLDRELLAGADPASSVLLRARTGALTSRAYRDGLADGLDRMLRSLDRPGSRMRVLPSRASIRANEGAIRDLSELLRSSAPVYAPGVAFMASLLAAGLGAAYTGGPEALGRELRAARAALTGAPTAHPLPRRARRARVRGGTPATRLPDTVALQREAAFVARRHEAA